jgi:hypothetical protein
LIIWHHATRREEHTDRLKVYSNKVLRIFEPMRVKITRWTFLDNEEVCKCLLFTIHRRKVESRRLRLAGYVKCMVGTTKAYTILDGNQKRNAAWET